MLRAPGSNRPRPAPPRKAAAKAEAAARGGGVIGKLEAMAFFVAAGVILATAASSRLTHRADAPGAPRRRTGAWNGLIDLLSIHPSTGVVGEVERAARAEPHLGRDARSPAEIPLRGWRHVLARAWAEFGRDRIMSVAAGVTFFTLLALFPAIGAFVSLYGLFADVGEAEKQLRLLRGIVPNGVLDFVGGEMVRIAAGRSGGLGLAFAVSLLISLWSANGAVKALFQGLNIAYEENEQRNFLKLNLVSFAFTLGALGFVMVAVVAVVVTPVALHFLGLTGGGAWLAELRWPAMFLLSAFAISTLYRYGPSRRRPRWRWINWGGATAAVLWLAASLLFSFYVANFAHYDKTYGSLGAVVGFMTWIWYSTIIVLFGAELNSELEHQTAVDTTVGAPKPMGQRGAEVADTLGASPPGKTAPRNARESGRAAAAGAG